MELPKRGDCMYPAKRIAALRKEHSITQKELARRIHAGASSISRYETGQVIPSLAVLLRITDTFDVSMDYLLGLTDSPLPPRKWEEGLLTCFGAVSIERILSTGEAGKKALLIFFKHLYAAKSDSQK